MEENLQESDGIWKYLEEHKPAIEGALREYAPLAPAHLETRFNEALEYALFPGGKRFRPILTFLGAELTGGKIDDVLPASVAVEFIHTSSLIFDDLPCMDNASVRRKKPSLHEQFGEALAILVGLGLLNASYPLVFVNHTGLPERAFQAHAELVECIGASGMVGGQSVDLAFVAGKDAPAGMDRLQAESFRNLKTSALIRLALRTGAILSGANYMELASLSRVAELVGDAYQLGDDLMDLEEDSELFSSGKQPIAVERGETIARLHLETAVNEAKRVLIENFASSDARSMLIQLIDHLAERSS